MRSISRRNWLSFSWIYWHLIILIRLRRNYCLILRMTWKIFWFSKSWKKPCLSSNMWKLMPNYACISSKIRKKRTLNTGSLIFWTRKSSRFWMKIMNFICLIMKIIKIWFLKWKKDSLKVTKLINTHYIFIYIYFNYSGYFFDWIVCKLSLWILTCIVMLWFAFD